jgi:hypothetical protein
MAEENAFIEKLLPIIMENYKITRPKSVVKCLGQYFGIFSFLEFLQFYAKCMLDLIYYFVDSFSILS